MKTILSEKEIFENLPVPKAVATLAIPTIISQIVTIVYNLADTFFLGQLSNPYMVAAVSLVFPWFNLITALGNLFGIGGSSLISRMLGEKKDENVKYVSAFCVYGGVVVSLCFSLITMIAQKPILQFLGASEQTYIYASRYLMWVVGIGTVPTMLSLTLGHLLRSEGHAKQASRGMMLGGILNIVLDPIFILGLGMQVEGAAIATVLSNTFSVLYFVTAFHQFGDRTSVSLKPKYFTFRYIGSIFSVGIASFLATTLASISNMVIIKLAASYGDIPVAAYGIVKKIDSFPLGVSMGLCQGFMPLVGYNYAAKNYKRISYEVGSFVAQCINFPLQRNITFKSHGNVAYQAMWYFIAWIVISLVCNGFNNLWMPIAQQYVAPAIYNILVTFITGGVSMIIFFFVFKIIFPEGEAKKS